MPDYLNYLPAGSGERVSTDKLDLNGDLVHLQRFKLAVGESGVYQKDLTLGSGDMASSVPVTLAIDQPRIPVAINTGRKATYYSCSNSVLPGSVTPNDTLGLGYIYHDGGTKR